MEDVCRICRAEASDEEPLYHPCRCSGSIRYVHEDCLMEWLSHARQGSQCELCRTKFTFQKHYKASMPRRLPVWTYVAYFGGKFVLVARSLVLLAVLAVLIKYTFELSTIYATGPMSVWSVTGTINLLRDRMQEPSKPFMDWLALSYLENRTGARELYSAVLDGSLLLAVLLAILAVVFVFAVWVFTDEALIHDLDHIAVGELGHIDHGDYEDEPLAPENPEPEPEPELEPAVPRQRSVAEYQLEDLLRDGEPDPAHRAPVQEPLPPLPAIPGGQLHHGITFRDAFMEEWTLAAYHGRMELSQKTANDVAGFFEEHRTLDALAPRDQELPESWMWLARLAKERAVMPDLNREGGLDAWNHAQTILNRPEPAGESQRIERIDDLRAVLHAVEGDAPVENPPANPPPPVEQANEINPDMLNGLDDLELQGFPQHAWVGAIERNMNEGEVDGDLWDTVANVVFGPTLAVLQNFFVVSTLMTVLIQLLYTIPYQSGYWMIKLVLELARTTLIAVGRAELAAKVPASVQPSSVTGHIGMVLLAINVSMGAIRCVELFYMRKLLKTSAGRYAVSHFLQTYVFYKAVTVVFMELFVFPEYCGTLLHLALLPALPAGSLQFTLEHPALVALIQFAIGFAYMYLLNYFVGACRSFFRPGALYFAQDPNDPAFEPTHAIVTHPLPLQLRRIALSGLIYTFLILGGVGGATYLLAHLLPFLFPLRINHWPGWNLFRLWPLAGSVYWTYKKRLISRAAMKEWWTNDVWRRPMKAAARNLDLDSWLFGEKKDLKHAGNKEGGFVRAPGIDNIKPRRNLQLFVPVSENDVREDGKAGILENEVASYTIVWRPRAFWLRLAGLMIVAWVSGINTVLQFTLTPLLIGQALDKFVLCGAIKNDLLLYLAGLCLWVPIWAKRTLRAPQSDDERTAGRRSWFSPSLDVAVGRSIILSVFVTAMYPVLLRGYSMPSPYPVVNWLILANDLLNIQFPAYQHTKLLGVSLLQLLMPNPLLEKYPQSLREFASLLLFVVQEGVAFFRLYQVLDVEQHFRTWSLIVRDRFYLEGKRLHNFGEHVTSFE